MTTDEHCALLGGELSREMDTYFPFENAPEVWGAS